jgi:hypothetical protein
MIRGKRKEKREKYNSGMAFLFPLLPFLRSKGA